MSKKTAPLTGTTAVALLAVVASSLVHAAPATRVVANPSSIIIFATNDEDNGYPRCIKTPR